MSKNELPFQAGDTPLPFSITLHFQGGGSDKIYQISIEPAGDNWIVNYANGRRGGTMAQGTKTNAPVAYEAARKICNSTLAEKVKKGYVPIAGSCFAETDTAETIAVIAKKATGFLPQLLNPIEEGDLERYLVDPNFFAQEKFFGERRLLIRTPDEAYGANRRGESVALPASIHKAALSLAKPLVLDCEHIGDTVYAFDVLESNGASFADVPLEYRLAELEQLKAKFSSEIIVPPTARTETEKRALLERVRAEYGEGVVFKHRASLYHAGRPASGGDWIKFKFYEMLSALVAKNNAQRSVALELLDDKTGAAIPVGNVTIPANFEIPSPGAIVEIRYLHAYHGGSLYEPVYLGERNDIDRSECVASQRKMKNA